MATRPKKPSETVSELDRPTKRPETAAAGAAQTQPVTERPELEPPRAQATVAAFDSPAALPESLMLQAANVPTVAPALVPPTEAEIEAAEAEGIAAWYTGRKVAATWSSDAPRNSYIAVPGLGWKKLANLNDSSLVSMTMLAAHAEQTDATVNIRIEADGMVHEIYVW